MEAAAQFLNSKGKAVLVAGFKLRPLHAKDAFLQLADASGYPVAGTQYTPPPSAPFVCPILQVLLRSSSDAEYVFVHIYKS